jgi:DNA modification methylase
VWGVSGSAESSSGSKDTNDLKDFTKPISQTRLDIEEKNRSNLFAWRGQFSPQLIEYLLDAYCLPDSTVLDPFAGSGTVLYEAATNSLRAFGFDINPSAWSFAKVYEFANMAPAAREAAIAELRARIEHEFPIELFSDDVLADDAVEERVVRIGDSINDGAKVLCNALIVLLDIFNNQITSGFIQGRFNALAEMVRRLPYSERPIRMDLQDARALPLDSQSIDFALTSPPYINVFNYHQNYRRSVEVLGWNLLRVARSEIGSNRANRGNRFCTVVDYCIDMATALQELARVLKPGGRAVLVVGYESRVLGAPFYNADIVEQLAVRSGAFEMLLRQHRVFTNRFGDAIREDILNLRRESYTAHSDLPAVVGRAVARESLTAASAVVPDGNRALLADALGRVERVTGTPVFNSATYSEYQTRESVMMVGEEGEAYMSNETPKLPTPHLDKLKALLENRRLPAIEEPRVQAALQRYREWIADLEAVRGGQRGAVGPLVEATNRYALTVQLDLIFDSPGEFLYRQKGQLKLDNTILEEFLPQLFYRGLSLADSTFELGPRKTFAGLSFSSSIASTGTGGRASLRAKDQDFVLGKRLYMMTSFQKDFREAERIEAHLGYVCAECKTNLDKTMFQEAVATSRDLKMAVPSSLYFLVCEYLDMTPVSITPTHIDDVLIVRKAKRMSSNLRQEYRTAKERQAHRKEYVEFLESARYHADVFQRMIDKVQRLIDAADPEPDAVLKKGYF